MNKDVDEQNIQIRIKSFKKTEFKGVEYVCLRNLMEKYMGNERTVSNKLVSIICKLFSFFINKSFIYKMFGLFCLNSFLQFFELKMVLFANIFSQYKSSLFLFNYDHF